MTWLLLDSLFFCINKERMGLGMEFEDLQNDELKSCGDFHEWNLSE